MSICNLFEQNSPFRSFLLKCPGHGLPGPASTVVDEPVALHVERIKRIDQIFATTDFLESRRVIIEDDGFGTAVETVRIVSEMVEKDN